MDKPKTLPPHEYRDKFYEFGNLNCYDFDYRKVSDSRTVTRIDAHSIDFNRPKGRHEIAAEMITERVFDGFAALQRGAQDARSRPRPMSQLESRP
jgi:hypothetical protein